MKRILAGLIVLAALVGAVLFAFRGQIALAVMERTLARTMAADVVGAMPDGLNVVICGSGGPMPDGARSGPCTAVIAGKRLFIVDTGEGAGRVLGRLGVGSADTTVLLTHFHSDHIDGLGNVTLQRWVGYNAVTPLPVFGPAGVERVVAGFNEAYALDNGYRTAHHGEPVAPPSGAGLQARPFAIPDGADSVVVVNDGGLKITAFRVDHGPVKPAVGYRFDYKGRSVVVSGDTSISSTVAAQARGADLLLHDALDPELTRLIHDSSLEAGKPRRAKIFADIPDYHAAPEEIATLADKAGVKGLVLTHVIPPLPIRALEVVFRGKAGEIFKGPLWIARDGDLFSLPAGGSAIEHKSLTR